MKLRLTALAAFAAGGVVLTGTAQGLGGLPVGTQGEHSDNVHALFNFPTGSGVGGRFDGSYYFQTTSTPVDMAGVGPASLGGGLAVFDVHNPEKPKIAGYLPLPEWENEDVSISHSRHLLTISIDNRKMLPNVTSSPRIPGRLYVIDISTPTAPKILSTTDYPASVGTNPETGAPLGGAGHTATFVGKDRYVMVSGARDGSTLVLDTFNASAPKVLGSFKSPAGVGNAVFKTGIVHDIYEDTYKNVWLTGSGGTAMYAPLTDPLHMKLLAAALPKDNTRLNQYITHNAMRIDKQTVMVTEESYDAGDCGNDADTGLQDG